MGKNCFLPGRRQRDAGRRGRAAAGGAADVLQDGSHTIGIAERAVAGGVRAIEEGIHGKRNNPGVLKLVAGLQERTDRGADPIQMFVLAVGGDVAVIEMLGVEKAENTGEGDGAEPVVDEVAFFLTLDGNTNILKGVVVVVALSKATPKLAEEESGGRRRT